MRFNFLCIAHRQQLEAEASKAIRLWQDGFETGQFFCEQGLWSEAVCHIGCAFEAADILLTNKSIDSGVAYEWFYRSALMLATVFGRIDSPIQAQEVLFMAIDRMQRELNITPEHRSRIMLYIDELHRPLNGLNMMSVSSELAGRQPNSLLH